MPVRSCHVTIRDMEGMEHTVHVTAATLCEAVALVSIPVDEIGSATFMHNAPRGR
jgi:hypothetical protein